MKQVLLVEDEKYTRKGIKDILEKKYGDTLKITECRNGAEAVEVLDSQKTDILVTDIRMPKIDGLALIQEVKRRKIGIRIIILSGYDEFDYAAQAVRCGAAAYLLKPVRNQQLIDVFEEILEELKKEDERKETELAEHNLLKDTIKNRLEYILVNEYIEEQEIGDIISSLTTKVFKGSYSVFIAIIYEEDKRFCMDEVNKGFLESWLKSEVIYFRDYKGRMVFISGEADWLDNYRQYLQDRGIVDMDIAASMPSDIPSQFRKLYFDTLRQLENNRRSTAEIEKAIRYISENYSKELNLAIVANYVGLNYNYFSGLFKKQTGVLFSCYLKQVRLEKAKELLKERCLKIAEVGCMTGYGNEKHFMKDFKAYTGITPTQYRDFIQGEMNCDKK